MPIYLGRAALVALALALASPAALAANLTLTPQPAAGQRVISADGKPVTIAPGARIEVGLALIESGLDNRGGAPLFLLTVINGSAADLGVTAADVVATADTQPLRVLTLADMQARARADIEREVSSARVRAAGQMQGLDGSLVDDPGLNRPTSQVVGTTVVTSGRNAPTGTGSLAGAARNTREAGRRLDDAYAVAERLGFHALTVAAGQQAQTPLTLTPPARRTKALTVAVSVGGEVHTFVYAAAPAS